MLPRGFHLRADGRVFYDDIDQPPQNWVRLWNVVEIEDEARFCILTPGQRIKVRQTETLYFTPKFGKPGWNLRKTYPSANARAGIGFLMSVRGKLYRFTPRKELVRR